MTRHRHRIIVEGMDGTGKTTLINHLIRRYPDFYVVPGLGATADFDTRIPIILDERDNGMTPIHDRFLFSELVYGPILRGEIRITPNVLDNAVWFLRNTAFLIYARPHSEQLMLDKPQMEGVIDRRKELLDAYDKIMAVEKSWFGPRFLQYVWHRDGETQLVEKSLSGYLRS